MKKIKELEKFEKPREKAVLLGSGVKGKDVIKLSREIVKILKNDFDEINIEKLLQIHGLGIVKQYKTVTSAKDIYEELKEFYDKKQEYCIIVAHNHPSGNLTH
ncbi:UPF0758 domain-containing protein [Lebetimonas sp. JH292]|uniref:UPF0758 domain-containing protein n=1 Tax=Lebetimonas sp. JH292 TaxID=990068 RepID=UPI000463D9A4|nr:UPF0758 domain-containing protein [Lebetimonas sp. JH292]